MSSNWSSGGGSGGVESWNTRTGKVMPATGDYDASQITGLGTIVNTFNGRDGAVVPASGDYSASEVTNALDLSNTGTQTMAGSLTVDGEISAANGNFTLSSANGGMFSIYTIFSAELYTTASVQIGQGGIGSTMAVYSTTTFNNKLTVNDKLTVNAEISAVAFATQGTSVQSVTIPASGTALPAVTENTILYIDGGVITGITLNTNALPTSLPVIYQRPGDSIVIDYTTAPTAIYAQSL